jgi:hypothetical protein
LASAYRAAHRKTLRQNAAKAHPVKDLPPKKLSPKDEGNTKGGGPIRRPV